MSASGNDGESETDEGSVVVRGEGVEVEKSHETERFPVPAIVFSIRSEREEGVEIRLADRVPEGVSMDDIGFHPEYGSEFWSVEGRTLVFERDVAGGAEAETVYGLRGPDAEEADRFLAEPTIEVWTGGESDSSFVSDINDKLTRSATFTDDENGENGDRGVTAGSEDTAETPGVIGGDAGDGDWMAEADERDEGDADDGERAAIEYGIEDGRIEKIERGERGEDGERSDDDGGRGEDEAGDTVATTEEASMENTPNDAETRKTSTADAVDETGTDAIAAQLARELRTGNVDSEDREVLRDVLSPRESVSARIDHLRSQVNDVAAYADALEAFLDENGSGRTLVRQQSERLDALREDVETVTERSGVNRADVEAIAEDVGSVEDDVGRIESDVDAFQEAVSDLDEEIERIDERFEESEARSAEVTERLDSVESHQEEIDERLASLEASHESEINDLREEMETRVDERVTTVERSTEDVENDVESLKAWRAQLAGALGGTDSGNAGATESTGNQSGSEES